MLSHSDLCGQREGIAEQYRALLGEHGPRAEAMGWRDDLTQLRRFHALTDMIDSPGAISVNDLGCGYGALFRYLVGTRRLDVDQYFGYDIDSEILSAARTYLADPRADLIQSAWVTRDADYSIACGTLFDKLSASDSAWTAYIQETLRTLAERSRRGFAFNLNCTCADWRDPNVYYGEPAYFFEFCHSELSRLVSLRHDYSPFEWSILVRLD